MGELETHNPEFELNIDLKGQPKTVLVKPDETSDGVEYYVVKSEGKQITQIRLDEDNNWEQLWGELSREEVTAIGEAIEKTK